MDQGFENGVVCLTGDKTPKIGGTVILDHNGDGWMEGPTKKAKVALVKVKGESDRTIKDTWPGWTPKNPDKAKVYDVDFVYGPLEITSEVYGNLTMSSIRREHRMDVINHLKNNHPTNTLPASISEAEEEESSDDDPSPPTKRRKRETVAIEAAVDLGVQELEEQGLPRAAAETRVLAEKIVQYKMRPSTNDMKEFTLPSGCRVDNVNLTTAGGWFDEFKLLSSHNALTARGQVEDYGAELQEIFGNRLKSRIVFFTERSDEVPIFKSIVKRWANSNWGYGLDEVVLVHMSEVKVDEKDARLKVIARSQLQGDIAWTDQEVGV